MPHYNADLLLLAPARHVYRALTTPEGLQAWWTQDCDIGNGVGDHSTFCLGETRKVMCITKLVPNAEVHWVCTDSNLAVTTLKRKDEWIGTRIMFRLASRGSNTLLQFEHVGLTPELECYALCTSDWHQLLGSLKKYTETGKGTPYSEARTRQTALNPI